MTTKSNEKREISEKKAKKFKEYADKYLEAKKEVPTGLKLTESFNQNKKRILEIFGGNEENWNDWKWQMRNRITDVETLSKILNISKEQHNDLNNVQEIFRWAFTPYLASLMDVSDEKCPIRMQMIPHADELKKTGIADFSGEEYSSPVKNLVRWYPDRVAIHLTNNCAGFCRHCLRRRKIGEKDVATNENNIDEIFTYLNENKEIRDVLFTGGDPFLFSVKQLDGLLTRLDEINHLEIKRIGTRVPLCLPQRVNAELCEMLKKHHPLYINIQVNHPKEITEESKRAIEMLADAGIPLGNQSVLMKGINDNSTTYKTLCHELLKVRVKPYYLYHCQGTMGIEHFRTPVETGLEIIENLRGFTSGMAVPAYIITPAGYGKTPLSPNYKLTAGEDHMYLRNWEKIPYYYKNPK